MLLSHFTVSSCPACARMVGPGAVAVWAEVPNAYTGIGARSRWKVCRQEAEGAHGGQQGIRGGQELQQCLRRIINDAFCCETCRLLGLALRGGVGFHSPRECGGPRSGGAPSRRRAPRGWGARRRRAAAAAGDRDPDLQLPVPWPQNPKPWDPLVLGPWGPQDPKPWAHRLPWRRQVGPWLIPRGARRSPAGRGGSRRRGFPCLPRSMLPGTRVWCCASRSGRGESKWFYQFRRLCRDFRRRGSRAAGERDGRPNDGGRRKPLCLLCDSRLQPSG